MPQKRFYNATDKLMNAFLTDGLFHGSCIRCAVATLCCGSWDYDDRESTGYADQELANIETAFEGDTDGRFFGDLANVSYSPLHRRQDADGFIGLSRVFDYLVSIEDWKEEESKVNLIEMCLQ